MEREASVVVGEGVVTLRVKGRAPVVAGILDLRRDPAGEPAVMVLDRLVHRPEDTRLGEWAVTGAYVTEMARAVRVGAPIPGR